MASPLFIGLDIGTSTVKAAAFRADGQRLAEAQAAYPTYHPQLGWAEQDPADWQAAITSALKSLAAALGPLAQQVAALGLSSHAPGLIPVDARGAALMQRIPIWQDERSTQHARSLLQAIGPGWVGLGMPFAAFAAKLLWFTQTHPSVARQAAFALGVKAYVLGWLTGRGATDPSSEPGNDPSWQPMCSACGWSLDRLAPVMPATQAAGGLRPPLAAMVGLEAGLPVVVGMNDGASATLGNGAILAGQGVITLGTNGVIYLVCDAPVAAPLRLEHAIFCWPFIEGRHIAGGQNKAGAASLQWLAGVLGEKPADATGIDSLLQASAGRPPGSRGVVFLPFLSGQGTPRDNPSATGGFVGLTLATERADLITAVLEGVAYSLRDVLEALAGLMPVGHELGITGGGARSPQWRQMVADVLNRPLLHSEGDSCLGAAMLAAVGVGMYAAPAEACRAMQRESTPVLPRPRAVEDYELLYTEYGRQRDALLAT